MMPGQGPASPLAPALVLLAILLSSPHLALAFGDVPTAYTLNKGVVEGTFFFRIMNDAVPLAGGLAKERGDPLEFRSFDFQLRVGFTDWLTGGVTGKFSKFTFGERELDMRGVDVGLQVRFLPEGRILPAIAGGVRYFDDRGTRERIGGTEFRVAGLEDDGWALGLLASKTFFGRLESTLQLEFRTSDAVAFDERTIGVGVALSYQVVPRVSVGVHYLHLEVFRDRVEDGSNDIFEGRVVFFATSFLAVQLRARAFTHLFQGEIPFLFREASRFRNATFGFVGVGITVFYDMLR